MGLLDNALGRFGYHKQTPLIEVKADNGGYGGALGSNFTNAFSTFNNKKQQLGSYEDWVYIAAHTIAEECATIDLRAFLNRTNVKSAMIGEKLINPQNKRYIDQLKLRTVRSVEFDSNGKLFLRKAAPALEELETHPLLELLNCPNPFMTKNEFLEITFLHLELTGNAYWAILERGKGNMPTQMFPLMPSQMSVVPDAQKFISGYVYQVNGKQIPFDIDDIIHHKYANPTDMREGYSAVQAGARIIDTDSHMAEWNRKTMYNDARMSGFLTTATTLDEKTFKRVKSEFNDSYGGVANAYKVALLEGGMDFKQLSLTPKDMDFSHAREFNRDQILALFGVPKSLIGLDASMSRANAEAAEYGFSRYRIKPKMQRMANRITEDLAPQFDKRLVISFTDPVPENKQYLLEETQAALGMGGSIPWVTPNEERAKRGDPNIPGGDELLVPSSFVPLGRLLKDPTEQEAAADVQEDGKKPQNSDTSTDEEADDTNSSDSSNSGNGGDSNVSSADNSSSTGSESTNDGGSSAKAVKKHVEDEHDLKTKCKCCGGLGEHYETMFECYRCDASGLEKDAVGGVPCDGRADSPNIVRNDNGSYEHAESAKHVVGIPTFPKSTLTGEAKRTSLKADAPINSTPINETPDVNGSLSAVQQYINDRHRAGVRFELAFNRAARERFNEQKLEVLAALHMGFNGKQYSDLSKRELKIGLGSMFDKDNSTRAWIKTLTPLYLETAKAGSQAAQQLMNNLGRVSGSKTATSYRHKDGSSDPGIAEYFATRAGTVSKGIDGETDKQLRATLTEGVTAGEGRQQLMDRVENIYGAASSYRADRIARTESQHALNYAAFKTWDATGIVSQYAWIANVDACALCMPMDGKIARKPEDFELGMPPAHPNCRCTITPYQFNDGVTVPGLVSDAADEAATGAGAVTATDLTESTDWIQDVSQDDMFKLRDATNQDEMLAMLWKMQGYDTKPELLSEADFAEAAATKEYPILYRGIHGSEQYVTDLRSGEYYAGEGIYGNGTYAAEQKAVALEYAGHDPAKVTNILLKEGSKIIDFNEISKEYAAYLDNLKEQISTAIDAKDFNKADSLSRLYSFANDLGRFATMKGYDAIRIERTSFGSGNYYILLNRGALLMQQ